MQLSKSTINSFRYIFLLYISVTVVFGLLFLLPSLHKGNIAFVDSLFLSASAISVTGLSSISITDDLTRLGQLILMVEIQLGGIGILVLVSYLFTMMGKRLSMSNLMLISRDQNQGSLKTISFLCISILLTALAVEALGFLVMFGEIASRYDSMGEAVFVTMFHVVACFTNAGFDLFGDSLMSFKSNPILLYTSSAVIFLGSVGYPTIMEYVFSFKQKKTLFTRINIRMHITLLAGGTLFLLFLEGEQLFRDMDWGDKLANSLFLSAAARNGGLTTVEITALSMTTVLVIIFLMFIGGASSSTGGGIRLTTFAVLIAKVVAVIKSEEHTVILKKTITKAAIDKAFVIFISFIFLFFGSIVVLTLFESLPIDMIMFETMSALTNTGLSTGITGSLTSASKYVLMLLMIVGRIGVFSLIYFVFHVEETSKIRYLEEDLAVG
ncbi:MAG: TrkH family potassium uptake protein [Bacillus sp. (in: firmicutes)]